MNNNNKMLLEYSEPTVEAIRVETSEFILISFEKSATADGLFILE